MRLAFQTTFGPWTFDGVEYVDTVELDDASEALVRAAGSAHAAGAVVVTEGLDDSHVQSQEDGEKALAAAMGDFIAPQRREDGTVEPGRWSGPWHEGNLESAALDASARATTGVDVDAAKGDE